MKVCLAFPVRDLDCGKNPRTVNLPQSKSLTGKARQTFMANAKISMDKLERYSKLLAMK